MEKRLKIAKFWVFAGSVGVPLNILLLFLKYQGIMEPAPTSYDWVKLIIVTVLLVLGIRELSICKKKQREEESSFK